MNRESTCARIGPAALAAVDREPAPAPRAISSTARRSTGAPSPSGGTR
ncbi:MAG: hypothetical protein ABI134_32445 [Byssovorax sp.]